MKEKGKEPTLSSPFFSFLRAQTIKSFTMESLSSPCIYTPPDALGTSTGDSISTHLNTIHADTPRPSMNDNISTSVNSVDDAAQRNESIASQLLTIGKLTASVLQNLSQQETVVAQAT